MTATTTTEGPGAAAWARRRAGGILAPLAGGIAILLIWEVVLAVLAPERFLLPRPSVIALALVEHAEQIGSAARSTGYVAVTGLLAGIVLGVVAALLVSLSRTVGEAVTPMAVAVNAMPIIALAPVFNAWFGSLAPRSNQAVVAVVVFFPVFIGTVKGLTQVETIHLELMESMAASRWRILREVRIPGAMPYFFTACKVVASLAVIAAIVDEYFGGRQDALGPLIVQSAGLSRYDDAWAAVAAGAAMGIALYLAVVLIERLSMPWARVEG
ncbi:MAG TPA: ABC transporter permease subunit [Euzebya sp.]|nr:ABC transporter permease subunit [Euzebya sp.]